jgi:hypothetical protein
MLTLSLAASCAKLPADGEQRCNLDPSRSCPEGFQCYSGRCYQSGHVPNLGAGMSDVDMSDVSMSSVDMRGVDMRGVDMRVVDVSVDMRMGDGHGPRDLAVGPDMIQSCGVTGSPCCSAPLAPCTNPAATCSAGTCVAADVWVTGYMVSGLTPYVAVAHYDGTSWSAVSTISAANLHGSAIWGYSPGNYFVTDDHGGLYQLSGGSWLTCSNTSACKPTGATSYLNSVFGVSSDDVWIGGTSSVMLHHESSSWVSRANGLPVSYDVQQLAGTASNDVWMTGFACTAHWDGKQWSYDNTITGRGIWSNARNDVWAVGDNFIRHYNGSSWSSSYAIDGQTIPGSVWCVGGSATDDVWVGASTSGGGSQLAHWNGTAWTSVPAPTDSTMIPNRIWVASRNQAWAAAASEIWQWNGTSWTVVANPPQGTWSNIFGSANAGR